MSNSQISASTPDNHPLRRLGNSGLRVSAVGLGCNNFGRRGTATLELDGVRTVVDAALESGVTLFDTADIYGAQPGLSEELLGQALGSRRDEVIIATKGGMDLDGAIGPDFGARGSRRYLVRAVEASLKRLGTDHIDLYQHHTPDSTTPIEETLAALDDLVRAGKIRYIGHSNRAGWQISQAEHLARELGTTRFISAQNHFNLLDRRAELEVLPAATHYGLGVLPYFPLANGLLTGKYNDGARPVGRVTKAKPHLLDGAPWEKLGQLADFAAARELPTVVVAIGWLLAQQPVASVISGATNPNQVRSNAAAAQWQPSAEDLAQLDEIFPPAQKVALF